MPRGNEQMPWEVDPSLTPERLKILATMIAEERQGALDDHLPEKGEDSWVLGTTAYQRCRWRIVKEVQGRTYDWLSIMDWSRRFIFRVGSTPIRFLRGDPTRSQSKTVLSALEEFRDRELQLPLSDERVVIPGPGWVWRLVVVPDDEGGILQIVLCQMKRGHTPRYLYPIAIGPITRVVSATLTMARAGKDMGPPEAELRDDVTTGGTAEAEGEGKSEGSRNGG